MWFDGWNEVLRVATVTLVAYAALVVLLRISGKRTLSKVSAFDLMVTVAIGSGLGTVILTQDVSVSEGVTFFAALIAIQHGISWLTTRSGRVRRALESQPILVWYRGDFLEEPLRRERLTRDEVLSAVRMQGIASMADVAAVVVESSGDLSVVRASDRAADTLVGVERPG